ncbi:hypothetical protein C5D34_01850 [Rathayibacter sp. AY1B1]|nr:hypothetical protein C5D34_01850 [Rathayibacter sp. AY1B1]
MWSRISMVSRRLVMPRMTWSTTWRMSTRYLSKFWRVARPVEYNGACESARNASSRVRPDVYGGRSGWPRRGALPRPCGALARPGRAPRRGHPIRLVRGRTTRPCRARDAARPVSRCEAAQGGPVIRVGADRRSRTRPALGNAPRREADCATPREERRGPQHRQPAIRVPADRRGRPHPAP